MGFVHVPFLPEQGSPNLPLDSIVRALQAMLEGERTRYVPDAIVYEDQPSTLKDTVNRNKRMGNGLFKLFFTHGLRCFGKFFTTFRFGFLDLFLTLLFVPIAVVACTWFPLYYG